MPRFGGTPVEQAQPAKGPRFGKPAPEEPSIWQQIGEDLADPRKALQAADDMARIGLDTASFGYLDPLIGKLSGEDERAKTQAARERAGWAGTGMDVATAVAATPSLAMRALPAGKGLFKGLARAFGYGAEGAAQSALSAHGHGKSWEEIKQDAITGGVLGSAGQKVGEVVGDVGGRWANKQMQRFKTADDVQAASSAKYGDVDRSGAHYPMSATDTLLNDLDRLLVDETATAGLDDRAIAVVNRLRRDWQGKPISPTELDKVRRWVDKKLIGGNPRNPDAQLGFRIKDEIDNFTRSNNPIDPVTGQPNQKVNADLAEARSLSSRSKRAGDIEKAERKAVSRAKKTGSAVTGGNVENTRRQEFGKIEQKIDDKGSNYSPDELRRLKQVTKGTTRRNIGRIGGAVSPLRGSLPLLLHAMTGGTLAPLGALGEAAALYGQRATKREIEDLAAVVRDPTGRGIDVDPMKLQQMRDFMAKLFVGGKRAGGD